MNLKKWLKNKISLKVVSSQSIFYLRSIRIGRFFLSQFFLELSLSAPSLAVGCIPVSSSLGTLQRSQQISWEFFPGTLFQEHLCWMAVHPKGWAWLGACPGHTPRAMGLPGGHGYRGLLDWEVSWSFLKGVDIMASTEEVLEHFLLLSERIVDRDGWILLWE